MGRILDVLRRKRPQPPNEGLTCKEEQHNDTPSPVNFDGADGVEDGVDKENERPTKVAKENSQTKLPFGNRTRSFCSLSSLDKAKNQQPGLEPQRLDSYETEPLQLDELSVKIDDEQSEAVEVESLLCPSYMADSCISSINAINPTYSTGSDGEAFASSDSNYSAAGTAGGATLVTQVSDDGVLRDDEGNPIAPHEAEMNMLRDEEGNIIDPKTLLLRETFDSESEDSRGEVYYPPYDHIRRGGCGASSNEEERRHALGEEEPETTCEQRAEQFDEIMKEQELTPSTAVSSAESKAESSDEHVEMDSTYGHTSPTARLSDVAGQHPPLAQVTNDMTGEENHLEETTEQRDHSSAQPVDNWTNEDDDTKKPTSTETEPSPSVSSILVPETVGEKGDPGSILGGDEDKLNEDGLVIPSDGESEGAYIQAMLSSSPQAISSDVTSIPEGENDESITKIQDEKERENKDKETTSITDGTRTYDSQDCKHSPTSDLAVIADAVEEDEDETSAISQQDPERLADDIDQSHQVNTQSGDAATECDRGHHDKEASTEQINMTMIPPDEKQKDEDVVGPTTEVVEDEVEFDSYLGATENAKTEDEVDLDSHLTTIENKQDMAENSSDKQHHFSTERIYPSVTADNIQANDAAEGTLQEQNPHCPDIKDIIELNTANFVVEMTDSTAVSDSHDEDREVAIVKENSGEITASSDEKDSDKSTFVTDGGLQDEFIDEAISEAITFDENDDLCNGREPTNKSRTHANFRRGGDDTDVLKHSTNTESKERYASSSKRRRRSHQSSSQKLKSNGGYVHVMFHNTLNTLNEEELISSNIYDPEKDDCQSTTTTFDEKYICARWEYSLQVMNSSCPNFETLIDARDEINGMLKGNGTEFCPEEAEI